MAKPSQIAIDGPAASGKTTVGKKVAEQLNYLFFDTGLMYRVATYTVLKGFRTIGNPKQMTELIQSCNISLRKNAENGETDVLLNGLEVNNYLHTPEIDQNVSAVSAVPEIRKLLTEQQRNIGLQGNVVLVGRDIGTVVLPDADLKIYLLASAEKRAERRTLENQSLGIPSDYQKILSDLIKRDQIDSNRETAPLKPAVDAIQIDTDTMTVDQVVAKILSLIHD